jgi:hypothetical protein
MGGVLITYRLNERRTDVLQEHSGMYRVEFYVSGRLSHVTNAYNLNEAKRLAENYVEAGLISKQGPAFLAESE